MSAAPHIENPDYLSTQIITYLGNKRALLEPIGQELMRIQQSLHKDKLVTLDLFSGSGIVARYLKQFSEKVIANDLEDYSKCLNLCYLSNRSELDEDAFRHWLQQLEEALQQPERGFVSELYAPQDEQHIRPDDRVFYTIDNAQRIDTYRHCIDHLVPDHLRKFFVARLIVEASIHVNTSGVFKGFYKDKTTGLGKYGGTGENALSRIRGTIALTQPVLSNFDCEYEVHQAYAEQLVKTLRDIDVAYLDPPYNQHPYGSNYFMLNLIARNERPQDISRVSGIPANWNKSDFNNKRQALASLEQIIRDLDARYIVISYNNEGFITFDEMVGMLQRYGRLTTKAIPYNTFRGCRNLQNRDLHTNEYIFTLSK